MVFSTTNLFKGVQCPAGAHCALTNCIFAHEPQQKDPPARTATASQPLKSSEQETSHTDSAESSAEPAAKRRKTTYNSLAEKPASRADVIREQLASLKTSQPSAATEIKDGSIVQASGSKTRSTPSIQRPISPPASTGRTSLSATKAPPTHAVTSQSQDKTDTGTVTNTTKFEALNPRLIPNDPAGHAKRSLYLKHLYAETLRLNEKVVGQIPQDLKSCLPLDQQTLTKLVLDEEEKIARDQPSVYNNVIKQRIAYLKKMPIVDWAKQIACRLATKGSDSRKRSEFPIETRISLQQEILFLPQLIADQEQLRDFEYILEPPSAERIERAVLGVAQSRNYEECDRCAARFQVFPDRNEQGLLASNGPCRYHPRRKVFPPRQKTDQETGVKPAYYPCCMEGVGTPGCTESDLHVYKTSSPGRLAAVLPFVVTPANLSPTKDCSGKEVRAVTFDCEMGYTTSGMELIRLTALTWPYNEELVDVLVRPIGTVIDLNSKFSGVFPEHFRDAIPYEEWLTLPPTKKRDIAVPPLVQSPQRARELLCSFITPSTPLIGHAINNDLNSVRLCHPTIIDTIVLYPHPRGLPMRFGLKMLTQKYINRAIQTGGDQGHDSKEDAVATGDLVRIKVGEKWRQLRASGWRLVEDALIPPSSPVDSTDVQSGPSARTHTQVQQQEDAVGTKRKRSTSNDNDLRH